MTDEKLNEVKESLSDVSVNEYSYHYKMHEIVIMRNRDAYPAFRQDDWFGNWHFMEGPLSYTRRNIRAQTVLSDSCPHNPAIESIGDLKRWSGNQRNKIVMRVPLYTHTAEEAGKIYPSGNAEPPPVISTRPLEGYPASRNYSGMILISRTQFESYMNDRVSAKSLNLAREIVEELIDVLNAHLYGEIFAFAVNTLRGEPVFNSVDIYCVYHGFEDLDRCTGDAENYVTNYLKNYEGVQILEL